MKRYLYITFALLVLLVPYDDPTVNVQWPDCGCEHKTSAKDKLHEPFAAQKFEYFEKW